MTGLIAYLSASGSNIFDSNFRRRFGAIPRGSVFGREYLATEGLSYLVRLLWVVRRATLHPSSNLEIGSGEARDVVA